MEEEKKNHEFEIDIIFKLHKRILRCIKSIQENVNDKEKRDNRESDLQIEINTVNGAFGTFKCVESIEFLRTYFLPFLREESKVETKYSEYLAVVEYIVEHGQSALHLIQHPDQVSEENENENSKPEPESKKFGGEEGELIFKIHKKVMMALHKLKGALERNRKDEINEAYYFYIIQLNNANGVYGSLCTSEARKFFTDYFLPYAILQSEMITLYEEYLPIIQYIAANHHIAKHLMKQPKEYICNKYI